MTREFITNVQRITSEHPYFIVHKNTKKGQCSFRITKALLDKLLTESKTIGKNPQLILTIPANEKQEYIITCSIKLQNK